MFYCSHISVMDLQTVCFTAVKVMCMLLLSSDFGLGAISLTCESKWEEHSEVKCRCMNKDSQLYRVKWRVYSSNGISTINCQMSDTFLTGEPCSSASELSATMGGNGSVLTIPSVTVEMNEVWCMSSFAGLSTYDLTVFARPVQPVCKVPTVISDHVVVMCYTTSVFPKGVCQFNIEGPLASMRDNLTGTVYTHDTGNDGKFQTVCGFGIPLDLVQDGQVNRFQVGITPGVSVADNSTAYSNWTDFKYVAASVLFFNINSQYKSVVTVQAGSPIVFKCITAGFPLTNVSIIRTNTYSLNGRSIFQKPATHKLNRTITEAKCEDAGTYACTADNGDSDKSPGIKVEVERKLQFAPGNTLRYTVYRSDYQKTFGFTVYGCPFPNYVTLTHSTIPVYEGLYSTSFSYSYLTLHLSSLDKVLYFGHNSLKLTMRNAAADEASLSLDVTYVDDLKTTTTQSYWDDTGDNRRDSESGSLNAAAAVGIVVVCVLVIAVCIITIVCVRRSKNHTSRRTQRAEYTHTVNQETYGRYTSTLPETVLPATRFVLEEQTRRQNRVPDIIPTSSTPTAPPAEDTTTNGDIQAYRNFSPPPSYEMVTANDGDEGLSTSHQDSNGGSGVTQPEVPPPSYESVQAALEPPPPPPYPGRQISSTYV